MINKKMLLVCFEVINDLLENLENVKLKNDKNLLEVKKIVNCVCCGENEYIKKILDGEK